MLLHPVHMHIPDGFLSVVVSAVLWMLSSAGVAWALRRAGKDLGDRQVPLMGVLAAAIFAGQMLNFSIAGGTSGHLLGAAIATILLGPWPAVIVLTTVVGIQALIFQDGGLVALGANLFNMAILGVAVSYFVYASLRRALRTDPWGLLVSGFAAAWCSIFISALAAALELAASGTSPANVAVPAMGSIHALIGVGEGFITVGALTFLYASRRDLLHAQPEGARAGGAVWAFGLAAALLLAVLSPLASAHPDGLMRVAEQEGFLGAARSPLFSLIPHYVFPGISNGVVATMAAAIVGTLLVFGVALGAAYLHRKRRPST